MYLSIHCQDQQHFIKTCRYAHERLSFDSSSPKERKATLLGPAIRFPFDDVDAKASPSTGFTIPTSGNLEDRPASPESPRPRPRDIRAFSSALFWLALILLSSLWRRSLMAPAVPLFMIRAPAVELDITSDSHLKYRSKGATLYVLQRLEPVKTRQNALCRTKFV